VADDVDTSRCRASEADACATRHHDLVIQPVADLSTSLRVNVVPTKNVRGRGLGRRVLVGRRLDGLCTQTDLNGAVDKAKRLSASRQAGERIENEIEPEDESENEPEAGSEDGSEPEAGENDKTAEA